MTHWLVFPKMICLGERARGEKETSNKMEVIVLLQSDFGNDIFTSAVFSLLEAIQHIQYMLKEKELYTKKWGSLGSF